MPRILFTIVLMLVTTFVMAQTQVVRRRTTTTTTTTSTSTTTIPQKRVVSPPKDKISAGVATTGTLKITSTPTDAVVKVDGEYMGTTPLTLTKRKTATYNVTVSAEGYETATRSVTVKAGETASCAVTLKKDLVFIPTPPSTSSVVLNSYSSLETITVKGVSFVMVRVEGASTGTFSIGETEVTQALWEAVMGTNPSRLKGGDRPVEQVSWDDCKVFISKLNSFTGRQFRLPKESEWEYAAKGGRKSRGYEYSGSNTLDEVGWYYENSGNNRLDDNDWQADKLSQNGCCTHPVKLKKPNELGLYDMSGNVWEWCEDLYDSSGSYRVYRGGSWYYYARFCRVSYRNFSTPSFRNYLIGLRLAL